MQAVRLADVREMTREEWLATRRRGIGGSDIAIIAGLNPWSSAVELYLDKLGELPERPETEAMRFGKRLEQVVADEFAERHPDLRVERVNSILQHPQYPMFLANIDRRVVGDGTPSILEIKTTSAYRAHEWEGDRAPFHAQVQVQWYLGVTGYQRGWIAALVGGQRYVEVEIQRDDEVIAHLQALALEFWQHVETGTPPPMDGSDASADLLQRLYPESEPDKQTLLPLEAEELLRQYQEAKAEEAAAGRRRQEAENRIKALLGDAEVGLIAGEPAVIWKTIRSQRIDTKRLRSERPDIYQMYAAESVSRRFSVKREAAS